MAINYEHRIRIANSLNKLAGEAFSGAAAYFIGKISSSIAENAGAKNSDPSFREGYEDILAHNEWELLRRYNEVEILKAWQTSTKNIDASIDFYTYAEPAPRSISKFLIIDDPITVPYNPLLIEALPPNLGEVYVKVGPVKIGVKY